MTGYDPFAYGQVRLGNGQKSADGNPDDILFVDAGPSKASSAPAADKDWELLNADVNSLLPSGSQPQGSMDFASEVLGEAPAAVAPAAPPAAPRQRSAANARPRPTTAAAPVAPTKQKEKLAPARQRLSPMELRGGHSTAALMVPLLTLVVGGTTAAWLAMMQQNPVFAGIVGVGALFAAAFLRVSIRR